MDVASIHAPLQVLSSLRRPVGYRLKPNIFKLNIRLFQCQQFEATTPDQIYLEGVVRIIVGGLNGETRLGTKSRWQLEKRGDAVLP
jgi:hypothetical protein